MRIEIIKVPLIDDIEIQIKSQVIHIILEFATTVIVTFFYRDTNESY